MQMSFLALLVLNHQVTFCLYFQVFHHNVTVKNPLQALLTSTPTLSTPQKERKITTHTYQVAEPEIQYGRTQKD